MYTPDQIRLAATTAAEHTVADLSRFPNGIITQDELFQMAGISPPKKTCSHDEYDQWLLNKMSFRQQWRTEMLNRTGRWPATVRGEGFRLLQPNQNVEYVETTVLSKIIRTVSKGLDIVRGTRDSDLTNPERLAKTRAELRFSNISNAANAAKQQAENERRFREATPPTRNKLPTPTQSE
jgi:hypothetical protein